MNATYTIKDFLEVKSAYGASFSPDGKRVAYLTNSSLGTSQIFLVPVEGGVSEQLTDFKDPISFVQFSPTKELLIFGKADGGNEKTQLYSLDLDSRKVTNITMTPNARYNFGGWSPDGTRICFASNERNAEDFDIYVMDVDTLEKHCISKLGGWCVAEGFSSLGKYLTIRRKYSSFNTDLYLYNFETQDIELLTAHEGNAYYNWALWLPDESAFFFVQDQEREFIGLASYSIAEKKAEYILTPDWNIGRVTLDKNGKNIAVSVNKNGYEQVTLYDPKTFKQRQYRLPAGNIFMARFSENGSRMSFNLGDSRHTSDIWILNLGNGESHQLTHSHQSVQPEELVEPELVHFTSFDGLSVPAFVYKPKRIKQGVKVPVLINIHGGPEGQHRPVYFPFTQYLVHMGFMVVAPNVRGSYGYGKTYMALDDVEKRLDSVKDIIALHKHIVSMPDIDTTKIALYGASYGGFMVLACMTLYPKLWAAAIDIVGIVNFVTFLENTAPYRRELREAEYASLQNNRKLLEKISPIHSIEKIEAPLLLIHGANDPRVPFSEAEQVVAKLKKVGRHVDLLVYPDEGHGIAKLQNRIDAYTKIVDFLDKELA